MYDETGRYLLRAKLRDALIGASIAALLVGFTTAEERNLAIAGVAGPSGLTRLVSHKPKSDCHSSARSGCRSGHGTSQAHRKQAALRYAADRSPVIAHLIDIVV